MTPGRWQQIRDVLEKALELTPQQRAAFLDGACLSDSSLRQEVEILLASSEEARSSFLQFSALRVTITPGTKLGDYEVKSLLGSGGMGEVYRARDSRLGRDVAIKVLPSFFSTDSDRLRRFEQEARAAAALNHPNILAVYQMGAYQGAPYLVSELLEGETLREQLKRGRLAVRKAIDYGVQIARGLAAAHEKGIVHRDLKPENLFVTKDGRVKILDFGLAKLTQPQNGSDNSALTLTKGTEAGMVMGTAGYMAPEQVRGQTADHRADIFAFGAILYEMLSAKRAFQKPTSAETMTAILNEDPPGISQVTTNIPPALQRVVHRCLEKNPEQRFQSASDLAFALDALSESAGSATEYPSKESERTSFIAQHKLLSIAVSLVLIGFVAAALFYAFGRHQLEVSREITERPLTANPPNNPVISGSISRDGKYLAYIDHEKHLYILQIETAGVRQLSSGDFTPAAWFPDGNHLLVSGGSEAHRNGLWKMSTFDGATQKIWDGDLAAVALSPNGANVAIVKGYMGGREIWLMDADGGEPHRIAAFDPQDRLWALAWSPSGQRLVYIRVRGVFEKHDAVVETCDLNGGGRTQVLSERRLWSPDGVGNLFWLSDGRILYSAPDPAADSRAYNIRAIKADPASGDRIGQSVRLTSWDRVMPGDIQASGDGRWVIASKWQIGESVYFTELAPGAKRLTPQRLTEEAWDSIPNDWTKDSKAVIFFSLRSGRWAVFRQDINQKSSRQLISGLESYKDPILSPTGERILYTVSATGIRGDPSGRLVSAPVDGGTYSVLLQGNFSYHCGSQPDSGCVIGEINGKQLVFSALDPVSGRGADIGAFDLIYPSQDWNLSMDGSKIAFVDREAPNPEIRIHTIGNHKDQTLSLRGWKGRFLYSIAWSADGSHFFVNGTTDSAHELLSVDLLGTTQVLYELPMAQGWLNEPVTSPDGRYLAFTHRSYDNEIVLLENF